MSSLFNDYGGGQPTPQQNNADPISVVKNILGVTTASPRELEKMSEQKVKQLISSGQMTQQQLDYLSGMARIFQNKR